jgi:hypothetical protein
MGPASLTSAEWGDPSFAVGPPQDANAGNTETKAAQPAAERRKSLRVSEDMESSFGFMVED